MYHELGLVENDDPKKLFGVKRFDDRRKLLDIMSSDKTSLHAGVAIDPSCYDEYVPDKQTEASVDLNQSNSAASTSMVRRGPSSVNVSYRNF